MTFRFVVGLLGALMILGGFVGVAVGAWPGGLWAMLVGGLAIVAVVLERSRYRSDASERSAATPGPGGGASSDRNIAGERYNRRGVPRWIQPAGHQPSI